MRSTEVHTRISGIDQEDAAFVRSREERGLEHGSQQPQSPSVERWGFPVLVLVKLSISNLLVQCKEIYGGFSALADRLLSMYSFNCIVACANARSLVLAAAVGGRGCYLICQCLNFDPLVSI